MLPGQNCDPNISGQYGRTPLHCAVHSGHLHIVKYLIDEEGCNQSDLDLDERNETLLHCAATKGHMEIVKFLTVEKHCDPTLQNIYNDAALHCAVRAGHTEIVKFLIEELKCPTRHPRAAKHDPTPNGYA